MTAQQRKVRARLDAIGERRETILVESAKLHEDTRKALVAARACEIPMKEAARRVKLTRTTIYQVYLRDSKTTSPVPAVAG